MNKDLDYNRLILKCYSLRVGGGIAWIIGAIFSYIGFTSQSTGSVFWKTLGLGLTLLVTILELWLNDTKVSDLLSDKSTFGDILLFLGGCLSYVYDAYTNVLGLCVLMLGIANPDLSKMDWSQLVVPVLAGVFLAGLPEPMMVSSYKNQPKKPTPAQQQNQQPNKHIQYQPQQQQQPKYIAQHKPGHLGQAQMMPSRPQNNNKPMSPRPLESGYLQASQHGEE
jgi:hypothetical protein